MLSQTLLVPHPNHLHQAATPAPSCSECQLRAWLPESLSQVLLGGAGSSSAEDITSPALHLQAQGHPWPLPVVI